MALTMQQPPANHQAIASEQPAGKPIKVQYTNYRGETAIRTIIPSRVFWGATEYHPEEQWLLEVYDVERKATRIYALKDITQWYW